MLEGCILFIYTVETLQGVCLFWIHSKFAEALQKRELQASKGQSKSIKQVRSNQIVVIVMFVMPSVENEFGGKVD